MSKSQSLFRDSNARADPAIGDAKSLAEWFNLRREQHKLRRTLSKLWSFDKDKKSVVFLYDAYYHFHYLSKALRKRGWDVVHVTCTDPESADHAYFHDNDVNLYHPDLSVMRARLNLLHEFIGRHANMLHFAGMGHMTLYPFDATKDAVYEIPWDFLELTKTGCKIGYTYSGCNDLVSQSSFYEWSQGACDHCVWQNVPSICSDERSLMWGAKVSMICDLVCVETDPLLDFRTSNNVFREPLTFAMDPEVWSPDIEIPDRYRLERQLGEVLVLHSMGNYELRTDEGRNIKGTKFIVDAVDELRSEGHNVRLIFHSKMKNEEFRYVQAQADIIVDQLYYGRIGATGREALMLGKPTVARIDTSEKVEGGESACLLEAPIVHADTNSIKSVLRELVVNSELRQNIGRRSREHAVKWWSADACAERYEKVYDQIMAGTFEGPIASDA